MQKKILVADPDAFACEALVAAITEMGGIGLAAKNSDEALRMFKEESPVALVVDTLLPRKGGFDFIQKVRETEGGDKVDVYVTCAFRNSSSIFKEAQEKWKAKALLNKPIPEQTLKNHFEKYFAKPKDDSGIILKALAGDIPTEGEFTNATLPFIFSKAFRLGKPCLLGINRLKFRKVFYFSDQRLVFARSNIFGETLARYLINHHIVSEDSLEPALQIVVKGGMKIGEAFVALAQTDPETIEKSVRLNIIEKVLDTFAWTEGSYRIVGFENPPTIIPEGPIVGDYFLWRLIMESGRDLGMHQTLELAQNMTLDKGRAPEELSWIGDVCNDTEGLKRIARSLVGKTVAEALKLEKTETVFFMIVTGVLKTQARG